ncbi:MAG: PAS domain-containing protein [Chthoniobacterales bacterium]
MSWITVVWSMNAAACLTLAAFYCVVWCKQRENWVHLVFSFSAVAAAAIAAFELAMMHAKTVGQYEALLRWIHVPVWVLTVSFVMFVRLYLHAGRPWLAWSICGLRTLVLILNFIFTPNLNFQQITSLRQFSWWGGEVISVPIGVANPWATLSSVSLLLLLVFFVDATITVWRRGNRRRALFVGGSMIFGAILAWHVPLVVWGVIEVPFFLCFAYLGIVAAMGYELSNDMARTVQLARELEASDKRLNLAADSAGLGLWEWDIVRNEIWITNRGRSLFGFGASEKLDFDRFRSRLHPEDREPVLNGIENSLRTGAQYQSEYRVVLPNGQLRWIAGRGQVECNGDGQPVRMRGASLDITKRKQAEEQLRTSEATLRESKEHIDLATKAAGLVVWTWDIPRDEFWVSSKDRALFGFSQTEKLTAERIRSVVHPEDRQLLRQQSEDALRTGREIENQYRVLLPDGRVRWVMRLGRVEFDADGKPLRERGILMDISERKQAELEAARQRHDLAHLARVTTIGELSSSLAHELTHPITAILINAQAAQRFLDGDDVDLKEVREILNDIATEDQRAGEVIHRLRSLLKKGEPQKHCDVNPNEVVQDVLKLVRNDLINQNVTADTDLAQNLPSIIGDRVQLQQVLLNLVLNACEAMADCASSERQLLIASKLEKSAVQVSVTDRGVGIPEKKLEQVFERFFTTKKEGMGLGLSICRSIIDAHEGKIWATNNADCGATFYFSLPIDRQEGRQ